MQSIPWGRPCSVCDSPARPLIDGAIIAGEAVTSIAATTGKAAGLSESAIYRHRRSGHAAGRLSVALPGEGISDVVSTLVNGIRSAESLRDVAMRRGSDAAALRAMAEVRAGSVALADRLKISDLSVADHLDYANRSTRTIQRAALRDPSVADAIAAAADELGDAELAADARGLAKGVRAHLAARNKN